MKIVKVTTTNTIEFQFPFNREIVDRIKLMSNRRYDAAKKTWSVILDFKNCFETERIINDYSFESDAKSKELIAYFKQEAKDLLTGRVNNGSKKLDLPKTVKAKLRPYQVEGFSAMVHWKKAINGCEMGLGKTLQALVAVEYQNAYPCLVICPASLKYNWANEIKKFIPSRKSKILDSQEIIRSGFDYYIINYDIIKKRKIDLERISFKSIICDESHYIKNKSAQRTTVAISLIKKIPIAYLLSGTPIENGPAELISQIESIDKMTSVFGSYWKFVNRYCDAKSNGFGLDVSGAKNLEELHFLMSKNFYFRKNKKEVLKDLPDKSYSTLRVEISNRNEYNHAESQLVDYLQNKIFDQIEFRESLKGLTKEEKAEYIALRMSDQEDKVASAEHLVLMTTLRKVTAQGKIKPAIEFVKDFIQNERAKMLVFAWHTEVVEQLSKELGCNKIHGGVDLPTRQKYVDEFQNNDKERILVLNIKAGGTGLNLTKASYVLFIEEPFNPALKLQAEDRSHRIGQENKVNIYTMIGQQTYDEDVHQIIKEKLKTINAVNAGIFTQQSSELGVLQQVLFKMMNK